MAEEQEGPTEEELADRLFRADEKLSEKEEPQRALVAARTLTPAVWSMITNVAPVMAASKMFEVRQPEKAAAVMLKGFELGLGLAAAFEFIHVIQGKPRLSPKGALALVQVHPEFASIDILEEERGGEPFSCTVTMARTNGFSQAVTFTMEDAQKAGLVKSRSGWEKYPANMLRWRAIGYCADLVFPDALGGLRRADEFDVPLSDEGEVVDGEWEAVEFEEVPPETASILDTVDAEPDGELLLRARARRDRFPRTWTEYEQAFQLAEEMDMTIPVALSLLAQMDEQVF